MRIAHVLTYVSADGAFGGPVAVAAEQAAELARRGHDVEVLAGWDGKAELQIPGVSVRLFPSTHLVGSSFSGIIAPALYRHLKSSRRIYDIVHVHLARDLISLPAAVQVLTGKSRLVVQTHGMVMPDSRLKAKLFDLIAVKRVLKSAGAVLALTEAEREGTLRVSAREANVQLIANGIASRQPRQPGQSVRRSEPPEVLFLARLHPRKRVLTFAEAAKTLIGRGLSARFVVIGPDEGDLAALRRHVADNNLGESLIYEGSLPAGQAPARMQRASAFVLPSVGEVFPMTVLEALSVSTPVVLTDDCGISPELKSRGAAVVTDGSVLSIADAIEKILCDAEFAKTLIENGDRAIDEYFGIASVTDRLEKLYSAK